MSFPMWLDAVWDVGTVACRQANPSQLLLRRQLIICERA